MSLRNMQILGVGVDLVKVSRVEKAIKRWDDRFLRHVFTPAEISYCAKHALDGVHYAARFAAKEALKKASGWKFKWTDIEIINEDDGKPTVRFVRESFSDNRDKCSVHLSMSHTDEYAIAYVVIQVKE